MAIPADEAPHLVLSKAHRFARFKIIFYAPSCSNRLHHLLKRCAFGSKDEIIGLLFGIVDAATKEQPVASIILPVVQDRHASPIEEPWPLGSIPHGEPLPILIMQQQSLNLADLNLPASSVLGSYPHRLV